MALDRGRRLFRKQHFDMKVDDKRCLVYIILSHEFRNEVYMRNFS